MLVLVGSLHEAGRDTGVLEEPRDLARRALRRPRAEAAIELRAVRAARGRAVKARVRRPAENVTQPAPISVVAHGDHTPLVIACTRVDAPRRVRRVDALGISWAEERLGSEPAGELCEDRLGLRHVDPRAASRAPARDQRSHRRHRRDARSEMVGVNHRRVAEAVGIVRVAPQAGEPGHTPDERAVAHPAAPRAPRPECARADDDEPRVDRVQHLGAEPKFLERARLEVREQDVRLLDEPQNDADAVGAAQVDAEAAASTMPDRKMHRRDARAVGKRAALQLDHVGAELAEQPRHLGAVDDHAEVEDADPLERSVIWARESARRQRWLTRGGRPGTAPGRQPLVVLAGPRHGPDRRHAPAIDLRAAGGHAQRSGQAPARAARSPAVRGNAQPLRTSPGLSTGAIGTPRACPSSAS